MTVSFFILDYLLRWFTADYIQKKKGWSFVLYPFTGWAIIDLLSILPGLSILAPGFKIFRVTRLLKILRLFKFIRYSNKIQVLGRVVRKEREVLLSVLVISVFYVFLTGLIMFNAEPHINPETGAVTFENFFDALYWATVTLTTVGYGDLTPVTDIGRFISMLSSLQVQAVNILGMEDYLLSVVSLMPPQEQKERAFALRKALLKGERISYSYIGLTEKADSAARAAIDETWGQIL